MAEVLGLTASVFSVVSLAIQLGDSLRIACEFWDSIEDGPEDIRRISMELQLLANILHHIQREHEAGAVEPAQEHMIKNALAIAKSDIDGLAMIVTELSRKISPDQKGLRRKWGRIQVVLKGGKIAKLKAYIESAKSILTLLQSTRAHTSFAQLSGKLDLVTASFSSMRLEQPETEVQNATYDTEPTATEPVMSVTISSPQESGDWNLGLRRYNQSSITSLNAHVVKFSLRSTSSRIIDCEDVDGDDDQSGPIITPTKYVVNMAWTFLSCRRGFKFTAGNNFDDWSFNTMRRRPTESRVFELSKAGNTRGVEKLLLSGEASLSDVDAKGQTLLHYACLYGHPKLAHFLASQGADAYQDDDFGKTPVHALKIFDQSMGRHVQWVIAEMMNIMIHKASFNPFEWEDPELNNEACSLYNGLPYENIRSLLTTNMYADIEQVGGFIYDNLMTLEIEVENSLKSLDFLLTQYERFRSDEARKNKWPYKGTLLQELIAVWSRSNHSYRKDFEIKISRALELTNDLFRMDGDGTALDTVARFSERLVQPWLHLLSRNGISIEKYALYELSQHPDGTIYDTDACCRITKISFDLKGQEKLYISLHNFCDPRYENLDPEYRCEAYRKTENCISQIDPDFIGEDGRQIPPLPGSWTPTLKPNQELYLVWRYSLLGWIYVEVMTVNDDLWEHLDPWWATAFPEEESEDDEVWSGSVSKSRASEDEDEEESEDGEAWSEKASESGASEDKDEEDADTA